MAITKQNKTLKAGELDLSNKTVKLSRVMKVVKGGRILSFSALVVLGDKGNNMVGYGLGKAREVADAVKKAQEQARKNLVHISLTRDTIPHAVRCKFKSSYVILNPAAPGRGIVAGGAMRTVLELAGVSNISAKVLGSRNAATVVAATLKALTSLSDPRAVAKRRGISIQKVFQG